MDNPWIDIRNSSGHLLFRYNPFTNEVEFKIKGVVYEVVKLDEVRGKYVHFVDTAADNKPLETIVVPASRSNGS